MAGILSDFITWASDPRYYDRKAQAQAAEQFKGLLGGLQEQGPVQPGGLLASRAPDQQFWLKAAAIPGYEQLAGQQLGYEAAGGQAMQRQMQAQQWEAQNLTAAQQEQLALQRQNADRNYGIAQQDLARKWYGTEASAAASLASAASSAASRDLSAARLEQQLRTNEREAGPLLARLPPAEQLKARTELLTQDTWATAASDVADWAEKRGPGAAIPGIGTAEADAFNTEWQTSVRPAFMQMMDTGVLQEGEREALEAIIGQPADKVLTPSQIKVVKTVAQKVRDLRMNTYKALGLEAPALQKGGSAAARTLSQGQPQGKVTPITTMPPAAGTIWNPVQRY